MWLSRSCPLGFPVHVAAVGFDIIRSLMFCLWRQSQDTSSSGMGSNIWKSVLHFSKSVLSLMKYLEILWEYWPFVLLCFFLFIFFRLQSVRFSLPPEYQGHLLKRLKRPRPGEETFSGSQFDCFVLVERVPSENLLLGFVVLCRTLLLVWNIVGTHFHHTCQIVLFRLTLYALCCKLEV